ncbi:MAG: hypothetical protein ACTHJV_04735 [Rhizobiaceae bacterium]
MAITDTECFQRIRRNSASQAIQRSMESRLSLYVDHPDRINRRLSELDREWDVEQVLQTKAGSIGIIGAILAATVDRKWLALPAIAGGFLLLQSLSGSSPPVAVLRHLGVRTRREIEQERYALKALRGDFDRLETFKNKLTRIFGIVGISAR